MYGKTNEKPSYLLCGNDLLKGTGNFFCFPCPFCRVGNAIKIEQCEVISLAPEESSMSIEEEMSLSQKVTSTLQKVKDFLPSFKYQLSTPVNKQNVTLSTVAQSLKKSFPTCKMKIEDETVLSVMNIDKGLRLGIIDKITSFWGMLRTVDARFSVQHMDKKTTIISDIHQQPTNFYVFFALASIPLSIPTMFFTLGLLGATIIMARVANIRIKRQLTRILEEVSFGAEVS